MRSSLSFLACLIVGRVASHPLCFIDDKPTDLEFELTFCPPAQDGACCTDLEEENVSNTVDLAGVLTDECLQLYTEVVCGVCHSYSAHLYERLGAELGSLDGMTMKQEFCDDLVSACADEIPAITRVYPGGLSYCEKHVGPTGDQFWSYPYLEPEIFETGLAEVFPDLDKDDDFPEATISLRQTPDGSEFWLMGQQGEIKKVPTNDLDQISNVVDISGNGVFYVAFEEGLLDMTFDPMFGISGTPDYFYLSYTVQLNDGLNPRNRISKFEYFPGDTSATLASEEDLITTEPKFNSIHAAGWCGFKPSDFGDGNDFHDLYWTTGDGGPQTDTLNTGQDTTNLLGSMIRISVPSDGTGFNIPSGNLGSGARPEICASGFRNPFRCSFDRATDVLYCGDVGHTNVEEIDIVECGNNYGWSRFEGSRCQEAQEDRDGDCQGANRSGFTFPFFEYCHPDYFSSGDEDEFTGNQDICGDRRITGHAVIGGYVYRGQFFSDVLTGAYIFGDATNRNIYYLNEVEGELVFGTIVSDGSVAIISFSEDINGEIMLLTRNYDILHMPCGDLCATTCLEQSEDNVTPVDQGCFADSSGDRVLTLEQSNCGVGERAMSSQICASYCDTLGATYAGVQFSFQCFCGNNEDFDRLGKLDQSSCEMLCTANPDEFCGGNSAMQVFEVISVPRVITPSPTTANVGTLNPIFNITPAPVPDGGLPTTPAPVSDVVPTPAPAPVVSGVPGTFVGCFVDTSDGRIMTKTATQSPMGSEVCQAICVGSLFYGTQFANECWCGGQRTDFNVHGPATNCDMPCSGNADEFCGGRFAMSVYENNGDPETTPAPVIVEPPTPAPMIVTDPTPSPIEIIFEDTPSPISILPPAGDVFLGCFGDDKSNRIMTGPNTSGTMSAEFCSDICDSSIYGTQFGKECWCGNDSTDYDVNGPATCNFECANNPGELCGGRDAMSVYSSSGNGGNPNPPTEFSFVGCFGDVKADRIMIDQISSSAMTSENCAALCGGRPFFGTQFGTECWCGEDNDFDRHGTATCDFDCSGDASEICGGRNAMSVYSFS